MPLVYLIGRAMKTDQRLWLFGLRPTSRTRGFHEFVENSKYLFLVASNEFRDSIRPVWISWSLELTTTLRNRGYESYWIASVDAIRTALQAGCLFSHSRGGIERELVGCGRAMKVELWHGIPLKSIHTPASADYIIATSESLRHVFAKCLLVSASRVIVSGYPRDDVLLRNVVGYDIGVADSLTAVLKLKKRAKMVLYAPTFRSNMTVAPDAFLQHLGFDIARLDGLLIRHQAFMIIKLHSQLGVRIGYGLKRISKRLYLTDGRIDVYPILAQADVLVTDYSSIFFDFLLLDRPIVFYIPDYDTYLDERGFSLNFDSFTPGLKAKSFNQLVRALGLALVGEDRYAYERKRVREDVFDNLDGHSSARVVKNVMSIMHLAECQQS
jgi:CDP-glycerol glycerophosphotransferase (TagB/SpsB family)